MSPKRHFCDTSHKPRFWITLNLSFNFKTMEKVKTLLMTDWSFFRVLRVVIGSVIMIDGFYTEMALSVFIGGIFLYQGIFNLSCGGACANGNCQIPEKKVSSKK